MKAQRRHNLQTNTLARVITKAPSWWQQSGGKLLLGAVVFLAIVLLVRYRITSSRLAESKAADDLMAARQQIDQLAATAFQPLPPAQLVTQRRALFSEAAAKLDDITRDDTDAALLAEATLAKGDLIYTMASLPVVPGATTNPSLQIVKDSGQLLEDAANAYRTILEKYTASQPAVIAAHFGLAAIAESQSKWDTAEQEYKAIMAIPGVPQAYLDQAKLRLDKLPTLRQPILIATPATAPAATMPAATSPAFAALGPAMQPATASATAPASRPAPAPPVPPAPKPLQPSTMPASAPRPAR